MRLIIDFTDVKLVDLSGITALKETASHTRSKKLKFIMVHVRNSSYKKFMKFGIESDELLTRRIDLKTAGDLYHCVARKPPVN